MRPSHTLVAFHCRQIFLPIGHFRNDRERKGKGQRGGGGGGWDSSTREQRQFVICTSSIIDFVCLQNFAYPLFLISPGYCSHPREIEDNTYAIFLGGEGWGQAGVLWEMSKRRIADRVIPSNDPRCI